MNIFLDAHIEVLKQLILDKVSFLLVGGYAVNFHGYNRVTGDLDLWIEPSNENRDLLITSMLNLGFDEEGISTLRTWDFEKPQIFHILEQPYKVEFLTFISGLNFSEAKNQCILGAFEDITIPVIHYRDLIKNKLASGRSKDAVDVEYLEKIRNFKN